MSILREMKKKRNTLILQARNGYLCTGIVKQWSCVCHEQTVVSSVSPPVRQTLLAIYNIIDGFKNQLSRCSRNGRKVTQRYARPGCNGPLESTEGIWDAFVVNEFWEPFATSSKNTSSDHPKRLNKRERNIEFSRAEINQTTQGQLKYPLFLPRKVKKGK